MGTAQDRRDESGRSQSMATESDPCTSDTAHGDGRSSRFIQRSFPTPQADTAIVAPVGNCAGSDSGSMRMVEKCLEYQKFLSYIPAPVCELAPDGTTLFVNDSMIKITGYQPEELVGRIWWDVVCPEKQRSQVDKFSEQLQSNDVIDREVALTAKDGSVKTLIWNFTHYIPPDGKSEVVLGCGIDITERKRTEQALRESEERYRTLVETTPDALVLLDMESTILLCNHQAAELLGFDAAEELVGRNGFHLVVSEDHERAATGQDITRQDGRIMGGELDLIRKDGTRLPVEISGSLIRDAEGNPQCYIALFHDVTERKRTAAALEHRLAVEEAVARVSGILAGGEGVDVVQILENLGQAVGADRAYVFRFRDDLRRMDNSHEWCAPGVEPQMGGLQDLATEQFSWWMTGLLRNETIVVDDVAGLPEEAASERAIFEALGVRSGLAVPLSSAGELLGFLGFEDMLGTREWSEEDIRLLRTASEALVAHMQRKRAEETLREAHDELERRVEHRTAALVRANQELRVEITERKRAEESLQEHLRFLQVLIDAVPIPVFYKSVEGVYLGCNAAFATSQGRTKDEFIGKTADDIFPEDVAEAHRSSDQALFAQGGVSATEVKAHWADGIVREVISYKATFQNPDGSLGGLVGTTLDITERKQAEQGIQKLNEELERRVVERTEQLRTANRELRCEVAERQRAEEALEENLRFLQVLIDAVPAPIFYRDTDGVYLGCNAAYETTLGHPKEQVVGKTVYDLFPQPLADSYRAADLELYKRGGVQMYEARSHYADGTDHDVIFYKATFQNADGSLGGLVGTMLDITERKRLEEELANRFDEAVYLADHDPVTGLLNHRSIHARLEQEVHRGRRHGRQVSVVVMDLDEFKLFNDTYGHPVGDEVLQQIAALLRENARETDLLGRYGGDEFTVILPDTNTEGAMVLAERFRSALAQHPYQAPDGLGIPIRMSFGIATYPTNAGQSRELISCADANLYQSKQRGGDTITVSQMPLPAGKVEEGLFEVLDGLVTAVDNKDHYTRQHSENVTDFAAWIAGALELPVESQYTLRVASVLHDVGKIGVPDRVLRKPGRLDEIELAIIRQHVTLGELMIKDVPNLPDVIAAVGSHHERVDGAGYPRGLKKDEIPLLGRIMAVADAYSAMTTDRPYRRALSAQEARAELLRVAGTQLDPDLVEVFLGVLDERSAETADVMPDSAG
ncbi:MAG: PAS domain S-box protein [Chloroflexota bacterium]|nr:MAG: PAS domain S-box protein [Chloroflexota bacterium]